MRGWIGSLWVGGLGLTTIFGLAGCGDDGTVGVITTFGVPTSDGGSGDTVSAPASTTSGAGTMGGTEGDTEVGSGSADETGGSSSDGPSAECGNDALEDGEDCDGADLGGEDCLSLGYDEGTLSCAAGCTFDESACVDWSCGDGEIQGREACDGDDLAGEDCVSLGWDEGTLACDDRCGFDETGCVSWSCGNDTIEGAEQCDGTALGGENCLSQGFDDGAIACDASCNLDTSGCVTWVCGDGLVTSGEDCDGVNLDGEACTTLGMDFDEGVLACDASCAFDTSGCIEWVCGNGILEGPEFCDGANLDGQDCASLGFSGGVLACEPSCGFDTSACEIWACGNNVIEGPEVCDNLNYGGESCVTQGFDDGAIACQADCSALDTSGCFNYSCGDGLVTGGEDCDGANLDGESCITQGFNGGTLACQPGSCAFDTSGCFACGDGVVGGFEQCDGFDLDGETCTSLGFGAGALSCAANCTFNTAGCVPLDGGDCCFANGTAGCEEPAIEACVCSLDASCCASNWDAACATSAVNDCNAICGGCGNDIVDQGSESCDGTDLDGETCASQGFVGGTLDCAGDCSFDTSGCNSCGNGSIDAGEACDGANLNGEDCASLGFSGGSLSCSASCQFDISACDVPGTPFGSDSGYDGYELIGPTTCDDISATGTPTFLGDDAATVVPIGFTFPVYGVDHTQANVMSNGGLNFGSATAVPFTNTCLPTGSAPTDSTLYVFWDDLNPAAAGDVYYQTLGVAPNRRFVVQWEVPHFSGNTVDLIRVQAMLSESSGQIDACYPDTINGGNAGDNGAEATAGIQLNAGSALQYSCNTPDLTNGLQLAYIPN